MIQDTYKTISDEIETTILEKKSKFICSMKPIQSEEEGLLYIQNIKKKYYGANHHCSAFIVLSEDGILERYNDDREPSGTAGKPMMEVLKGAVIKNVIAVVSRYFGGVLLGTGGLIKAYTDSVKTSMIEADIYENVLCEKWLVETDYSSLPKIEYEVLQCHQKIYETTYAEKVSLALLIERNATHPLKKALSDITNGQCKVITEGLYFVCIRNEKIILGNKLSQKNF